ncbi:MAG: PIG-L family deacetylase, partial [Acidobacteriaceae bacterium]|nr:PIG-L family deacetylase [Acidobacteriaceae bacterium]
MHRSTLLTSKTLLLLTGALTLCAVISAGGANPAVSPADLNPLPIELDRGAAGLLRSLAELRTRASILMVTAHPDDEDGGLLTYMTRGIGARGVLMTLTRGEGGQNEMSDDLYDALGLLRTQELLAADRYYGVEQYWGTVIDYGFSKTREEALEKWGYDRVLGDVVRVIRMTRPLVIMSVFAGAPTDGHGNHQVSGQMAQEAFAAASDPNQFPEQMHEGLRPWSPAKVYARVPFFEATDKGIYDYATDKYVPVRFYDYVNKTWINKRPDATVEIPEGRQDPVTGLTFLQMGREGLGEQRSQNGGLTIPPAVPSLARYHRYGTRVNAPEHETSVYDGIDVSLEGIASATEHAPRFLAEGLQELAKTVNAATDAYRPSDPSAVAPSLAEGLRQARGLLEEVQNSDIPEPGRSDIAFELELKTKEFEHALLQALAVSLQAYIAPDKEPAGPFAAFAGPAPTFTVAIPGQSFSMKAHVMNGGREAVHMEGVDIAPTDGTDWQIHAEHAAPVEIAPEKDTTLHFTGKVSVDAQLTRAYFARPDQEQPYYNLLDERYRNLSFAPSPLIATAHFRYRGEELAFRTDVETMHRVEGIGIKANPLIVGPAISVQISPSAGAVPLNCDSFALSKNSRKTVAVSSAPPKEQANECTDSWRAAAPFALSCNLRSNVKGNAKGILRLRLPEGWRADPDQYAFELERDGDTDNVTFHVEPKNIKAEGYEIRAIAEYGGHTYAEGYRWTGYPGVRPYPYYRPATY